MWGLLFLVIMLLIQRIAMAIYHNLTFYYQTYVFKFESQFSKGNYINPNIKAKLTLLYPSFYLLLIRIY